MCLESMHIIQIGLPVFHKASVVGGQHPGAVVGPGHAADCTVVALERGGGGGGGGGHNNITNIKLIACMYCRVQ